MVDSAGQRLPCDTSKVTRQWKYLMLFFHDDKKMLACADDKRVVDLLQLASQCLSCSEI